MSHIEQKKFIKQVSMNLDQFFNQVNILEIGSLDINGSVREFFNDCQYIGIDVAAGKGVDEVCQGQEYKGDDSRFDHVISCEAMEHNPFWEETFRNMVRLCKEEGLVVFTCATTGRREHGTPDRHPGSSPLTVDIGWSHYKNLEAGDFKHKFDLDDMFSHYCFWSNWNSFDLYFCGIKKNDSSESTAGWSEMTERVNDVVFIDNKTKRSVYRRLAAKVLGDRWFIMMRFIAKSLKFKHLSLIHGDW